MHYSQNMETIQMSMNWWMSKQNVMHPYDGIFCHKKEILPWLVYSVDWAQACELKGCQFNSWSGHMPGFWARSPVGGVWEAADQCFSHTLMFLSLSFSLPSPLSKKINKTLFLKKGSTATCNSMDEFSKHCATWTKPIKKDHVFCNSIYRRCPESANP